MTPVMLPTSDWSAKWYHLHKWKFFYGQIELTCRFSNTLKGVLYPEGLSASEVEEPCYLLILVLLHGPLRHWRMRSFTEWGEREWSCKLLHRLGSLSRKSASCSLFQPARTNSLTCTTVGGLLIVTSMRATWRPWLKAMLSLNYNGLTVQ